jgi:putative ABC transport system substrate-binding protein
VQATTTIPIVMTVSGDVVAEGLVASLARPGGNVTGLTSLAQPLDSKRLEYLKAAHPSIGRVAVLWNASHATVATSWRELEVTARTLGLQTTSLGFTRADELEMVLSTEATDGVDALLVLPDPLTTTLRKPIVEFALEHRLPSMFGIKEAVEEGGLMTYSPDRTAFYQRAADYVDRILKGANPAEMPIERPTRFELVLNLKTAQAIGITFPSSILSNATSVLQ